MSAADALSAKGLSISQAIRLLMLRVADEKRLPSKVNVPNATTRKAMTKLRPVEASASPACAP
jgi:DNA-damage-inducible protein J